MIQVTKELRALLKSLDAFQSVGKPRDFYFEPQWLVYMETIQYSWGHGTHLVLSSGGGMVDVVVTETPEEILDKIKLS